MILSILRPSTKSLSCICRRYSLSSNGVLDSMLPYSTTVTNNSLITSTIGISLKTQELRLVVFVCRYLDLLTTFYSLYNSIVKATYINFTAGIIIAIRYTPCTTTNRIRFPTGSIAPRRVSASHLWYTSWVPVYPILTSWNTSGRPLFFSNPSRSSRNWSSCANTGWSKSGRVAFSSSWGRTEAGIF